LKRKEEGEKLPTCNVTCVDAHAGKFHVKGSMETVYNVSFGSPEEMPSCSCPDYVKHRLPCKHFFAVFHLHEHWGWESLPTLYLSSPYMSIDWPAIRHYFTGKYCENQDEDQQVELHQPSEWLDSLEREVMESGEELHVQEGEQIHRQEVEWLDGQGEWLERLEGEAVDAQGEEIHTPEIKLVNEEDKRREVEVVDKQRSEVINQDDELDIELETVMDQEDQQIVMDQENQQIELETVMDQENELDQQIERVSKVCYTN